MTPFPDRLVSFFTEGANSHRSKFSLPFWTLPAICSGRPLNPRFASSAVGQQVRRLAELTKTQTAAHRRRLLEMSKITDEDERVVAADHVKSRKKRSILCVTPAGDWSEEDGIYLPRKASVEPASWTCAIAFDVDHIDDPAALRDELARNEFCALAAISASGTGVWFVVVMDRPPVHPYEFRSLWADANAMVVQKFRLDREGLRMGVDASCKDASRLRFLAHDEQAHWNRNVRPLRMRPRAAGMKAVADVLRAGHLQQEKQNAAAVAKMMAEREESTS